MTVDRRTPVLVGVGTAMQNGGDRPGPLEALDLMAAAVDEAASDSGRRHLLDRVGWIGVPEGTWGYGDPGRLLADRLGLDGVHTVRADVGRTQEELIARAGAAVLDGRVDVALVVGGEAKHRAVVASRSGVAVHETAPPAGTDPDEVLAAGSLGLHDLELVRNTVVPSTSYALVENALAASAGSTPTEQRERLANLYGGFADVASHNPDAWDRSAPTGGEIVTPSADNRMIASPYTKLLCAQWNVDQAAALLIGSVEAASSLGVPHDRWVFAHSSAVANHAVPLPARPRVDRSPGARLAGRRALALAEIDGDDLAVIDLYSCFPSAVQVHATELGLGLDRRVTQTGGMSFAGGPLNNYVVQAMVRLAVGLRTDPAAVGLSSSVSGFLTKHGFGVWSATPPPSGRFRHDDVSAELADEPAFKVDRTLVGTARVVASTVVHHRGTPHRAVAIVEALDRPVRSVVESADPSIVAELLGAPWIGRAVEVQPGGGFTPG